MEETQRPALSEAAIKEIINILSGKTVRKATQTLQKGDGTQMEGVQTGNPFGDQKAIDAFFTPKDENNQTSFTPSSTFTPSSEWVDRNTELVEEPVESTEDTELTEEDIAKMLEE